MTVDLSLLCLVVLLFVKSRGSLDPKPLTLIPPWRRTYTNRDRWLKRGNDEGWHRRRHREWKGEHWRGSSPKRNRAKGKGKTKGSRTPVAKPKARPYSIWTSSGRREMNGDNCEMEEEEEEVVEVEDEAEASASRTPGPRPDREPFTVENAMHLWREFLDMGEDEGLGYPEWALDRVRDTIEDWSAEDASTLLAAHQQFLGLVMAQVAEIAQRRIARARQENRRPGLDRDDTSLMQTSQVVKSVEGGISTYGLELQFLTDEFAGMDAARARIRSSLLRTLLARRYGCASGRLSMGTRAMALEAAVVAYDDEDRRWGERWWKRLIGPIMEEERQLRVRREALTQLGVSDAVVESLDSSEGVLEPVRVPDDIDNMVEEELAVRRQIAMDEDKDRLAWEKERHEVELQEYERDRAIQESEDEARYELLQAQYAQEWDDWVVWRSMHSVSPPRERPVKKQKMVLTLQVQHELAPATKLVFDVSPGMPTTIGLTWTVTDENGDVDDKGEMDEKGEGTKASSSQSRSQSPTEKMPSSPSEHCSVMGSPKAMVPVQGHISEGELAAFMTGFPGLELLPQSKSSGCMARLCWRHSLPINLF